MITKRVDIDKAIAFTNLLLIAGIPFSVSYENGTEWIPIDARSSYKECWAIFTFEIPSEIDGVHVHRIYTF